MVCCGHVVQAALHGGQDRPVRLGRTCPVRGFQSLTRISSVRTEQLTLLGFTIKVTRLPPQRGRMGSCRCTSTPVPGPASGWRVIGAVTTPLVPCRLPRRDRPFAQWGRPAGTDPGGHRGDRRRCHDGHPARARLAGAPARPVRPDRRRRRRRAAVAGLLADLRSSARRAHRDHRQGHPRREGQQPPRAPCPPGHDHPARPGHGRLPPAGRPRRSGSCSSPPAAASPR